MTRQATRISASVVNLAMVFSLSPCRRAVHRRGRPQDRRGLLHDEHQAKEGENCFRPVEEDRVETNQATQAAKDFTEEHAKDDGAHGRGDCNGGDLPSGFPSHSLFRPEGPEPKR